MTTNADNITNYHTRTNGDKIAPYQPFNGAHIAPDDHTYGADCTCSTCDQFRASTTIDARFSERRQTPRRENDRREIAYAAAVQHMRTVCNMWIAYAVIMTLVFGTGLAYAANRFTLMRHDADSLYSQLQAAQGQLDNARIAGGQYRGK